MSLLARAILLRQQLKKSKNQITCQRCLLPYDSAQETCPHCTGLSDRQVEDLRKRQHHQGLGNALYLVLVLAGLMLFFGLLALFL